MTKLRTWTTQSLSVIAQLKEKGFTSDMVFNDHARDWKFILVAQDGRRFKGEGGNSRQGGIEPYEVAFWNAIDSAEKLGALDVQEKTGR